MYSILIDSTECRWRHGDDFHEIDRYTVFVETDNRINRILCHCPCVLQYIRLVFERYTWLDKASPLSNFPNILTRTQTGTLYSLFLGCWHPKMFPCQWLQVVYTVDCLSKSSKQRWHPERTRMHTTFLTGPVRWFWQDCAPATTGSTHTCTGN